MNAKSLLVQENRFVCTHNTNSSDRYSATAAVCDGSPSKFSFENPNP